MNEWRADKKVTISQILAILSLIAALVTSWNDHEKRIAVLESRAETYTQVQRDIRDELTRMNNKIDRMVEKSYSK